MPNEEVSCTPNAQLMQPNEILSIAKKFVALGVDKIRLTGGEPLVRKEAREIIHQLSQLPVELCLTTNGALVHKFQQELLGSSIGSVNVSLDSLDENKFEVLTKRNHFGQVLKNIEWLLENNFSVKVNVVLIKGINNNEINDFIELTRSKKLHIRFIEFMPFTDNGWQDDRLVSQQQILNTAQERYDIIKLKDEHNATAKKYKAVGCEGTFAIISTMTNPFCDSCNRIRLTADGKIKNCLFSKTETDLLGPLRNKLDIEPLLKASIKSKKEKLGGQLFDNFSTADYKKLENRSMISIGG
jgi:cyclic pyranopterin phosphate synthase